MDEKVVRTPLKRTVNIVRMLDRDRQVAILLLDSLRPEVVVR